MEEEINERKQAEKERGKERKRRERKVEGIRELVKIAENRKYWR